MRMIHTHETNEANKTIAISADERDEKYGNASHAYGIMFEGKEDHDIYIDFQRGPIKEVGVNGITNEALLANLIDRLEGFQSGPFACELNAEALSHLQQALNCLHTRTKEREARGVEGTNVV